MANKLNPPFSRVKSITVLSFVLLLAINVCSGYNPESRLVDVGGYRLNIRCAGDGAPAVVLDAGLASDNHAWEQVEKRVSGFTRVCSYDRAGLGRSDAGIGDPTSQTAANDLYSLMLEAGISVPVVLVGHSYGGLIVQLYASQHAESVVGVVLVDSLHPDNFRDAEEILGRRSVAALISGVQANPEGVDVIDSLDQVGKIENLGDLPLTVITASRTELPSFIDSSLGERLAGSWLDAQRELVGLSSAGVQVIAEESGHCVQCDQPDLVADVIRRMVEAAPK